MKTSATTLVIAPRSSIGKPLDKALSYPYRAQVSKIAYIKEHKHSVTRTQLQKYCVSSDDWFIIPSLDTGGPYPQQQETWRNIEGHRRVCSCPQLHSILCVGVNQNHSWNVLIGEPIDVSQCHFAFEIVVARDLKLHSGLQITVDHILNIRI